MCPVITLQEDFPGKPWLHPDLRSAGGAREKIKDIILRIHAFEEQCAFALICSSMTSECAHCAEKDTSDPMTRLHPAHAITA